MRDEFNVKNCILLCMIEQQAAILNVTHFFVSLAHKNKKYQL